MDTFNAWDAFNKSRAAADQSNLAGLQQATGTATLAGTLQKLQLETQFRNEIAAAKTPEERSAVAAKYASPADIFKRDTESADQKAKTDATKELARSRIQQAAQQFNQMMDLRIGAAKTAQEKLLLEQQKAQGMMQLQAEHAKQVGEANTYNFGIPRHDIATPQITVGKPAPVAADPTVKVADTVSPAEIQRIQDPQERAQAMAAMQGGQTYSPNGAPAPAPAAMPPEAPIAPPAAATPPPAIPPQGDMRDVMAARGQFGSSLQSQLGPRPAPAIAAQLGPQGPIATAEAVAPPTVKPMPANIQAMFDAETVPKEKAKIKTAWMQSQLKNEINLAGGRESVMTNRVVSSGNQAAYDLENIARMGMTASRGTLGGRGQDSGLMNAVKETLANKITSEEARSYNTRSTGFARSLATLETQGLQSPGAFTHSLEQIRWQEGDSNFNKLEKLAQTRQIILGGLETSMTNPRVPPETKAHIQDIMNRVSKTIPFTIEDLDKLQAAQQTNPKITLGDVIKLTGKPASTGYSDPEKELRYQQWKKANPS